MRIRFPVLSEAMRCINANGGLSGLSMTVYQNLDLGADKVSDVWQLENSTSRGIFATIRTCTPG